MNNDTPSPDSRSRESNPNARSWEEAYLAFETPEQEVRKFVARLRVLGADNWPRDARIVELFCGRGNGLHALNRLGFTKLEGVDLSPRLLTEYTGPGRIELCDCRRLTFPDGSRDIAIVQGGLHHLQTLPEDLEQTVVEVHRVLRPHGRFAVVEPWLTPYLRFVHAVARNGLARKLSRKLDTLQTMIEHEGPTYWQWLAQQSQILIALEKHFDTERRFERWGKLTFLGRRRG